LWAKAIVATTATFDEPSDGLRLMILRAKDQRLHEKTQRVRAGGGGGNEDLWTLTTLLIAGTIERLTPKLEPLQGLELQPNANKVVDITAQAFLGWVPIETGHWEEINEHNINFLISKI
jgi:hypothetical protein